MLDFVLLVLCTLLAGLVVGPFGVESLIFNLSLLLRHRSQGLLSFFAAHFKWQGLLQIEEKFSDSEQGLPFTTHLLLLLVLVFIDTVTV